MTTISGGMSSTDGVEYEEYVRVPLHKSCILVLSPEEFARAVRRGKALRRREAFLVRQGKAEADAMSRKVRRCPVPTKN